MLAEEPLRLSPDTKNPFVSSSISQITQSQLNFIADPYVRVAFLHQSKTTKTVEQTLCPTWDQTLIFEEMVYGELLNNPPTVVMELFDRDKVLKSIRFSLQSCLFTITFDCLFVCFCSSSVILLFVDIDLSSKIYFDYSNLIKWGINCISCFLFPINTYIIHIPIHVYILKSHRLIFRPPSPLFFFRHY